MELSKRKNAWRGTCAQGASSLKYGGCSSGLPPILHPPTDALFLSFESAFPAFTLRRSSLVVIGKPALQAPLTLLSSASGNRRRGCPGPPNPRAIHAAGRDLPKTRHAAPPRNIFSFPPCTAHFLFDVSKRKWGVHSAGKAGVVPRPAPVARKKRPRAASARKPLRL